MAPSAEPLVVRAEVWECPLPLAHVLRLGAISYVTRDYVVLRLTTEDGRHGHAVGYTRHTPLLLATATLCRQLSGLPANPGVVHQALRQRFAPGWAAMVRGASLVDIALWDLAAQRARSSLAAALGHPARPAPAMAVAGYFADIRSVEEQLEEIDRFVADGYAALKLILPGHDPVADRNLVSRVRERAPAHVWIGVDFHGAFATIDQALRHCMALQDLGVRFLEDPFPSSEWRDVRDFARGSATPVAAGEDVPGLTPLVDLIDGGVLYLRADVTASGGYTVVRRAAEHAAARGARLLPHVWPHLHAPLVAGGSPDTPVEVIPEYVGADPLWALLTEGPPVRDGLWHPPDRQGLWLPLDGDAVSASATEYVIVELGSGRNSAGPKP